MEHSSQQDSMPSTEKIDKDTDETVQGFSEIQVTDQLTQENPINIEEP